MEVKPGYKQSDVGLIPEDWKVKPLGDIGESLIGLTYTPAAVRSDGILVLRSSNVQHGHLSFDDNVFVDMEVPERIMMRAGDILICVRNGSRELIGKCARIDERAKGMTFGAFMAVFRTTANRIVYFQFQSAVIKRQIHQHLGATINQITNKSLNSFSVPLPPTKAEQEAIAEALSDAEALVESLEHLLAKKRQIKQAAMQELLTGKKRLQGFSGAWETVTTGDIGRFAGGCGFPTRFQGAASGDYPFFKVSDMNNEGNQLFMRTSNNYISEALRKQLGATAIPANSIVLAKVGAAVFLERKKILVAPSCLDNNMAAFVINADRAHYRFIHYVLLSRRLGDLVSTTALPSLSSGVLASVELDLPPLVEQFAIAAILIDMDADIAALETKLAKAHHIKQGMMQELLTGRIRLV